MPVHNTTHSCRLGRRPDKQGPRYQLSNQGWNEKWATERKPTTTLKHVTQTLSIGTWNVRTLWAAGRLQLLQEEISRFKCDILGISEMRWTMAGETNDSKVLWSGNERKHEAGVGFLLSDQARKALLGYKPINERLIAARFSAQPFNITVIQAYAPTADSQEEAIENFYEDLTMSIEEVSKNDILVVIGDWNAKIGKDNAGWD